MSPKPSIHDPIIWEGQPGHTAILGDLAFEDVLAVLAKRVDDHVAVEVLGASSERFCPLHAEGVLKIEQDPRGLGEPDLAATGPALRPEESVHYYNVLWEGHRVATFTVDGAAFRGAVLTGDTHRGPPPRLYITLGHYNREGKIQELRLKVMFGADKPLPA